MTDQPSSTICPRNQPGRPCAAIEGNAAVGIGGTCLGCQEAVGDLFSALIQKHIDLLLLVSKVK